MPEGPEIRRAAGRIADAVLGKRVEVEFGLERLQPYAALLSGETVVDVTSRGKAMLIRFSNDLTLYSHNQLYGVWYVRPKGKWPQTHRQLRVSLVADKKMALLYSASEIKILSPAELAAQPFLQRLGPDVLDAEVTLAQVLERYRDPRFARRRITALLLDQAFLAGMGNYLRSEILFLAGIHPDARPIELSPIQLQALAEASILLPRRSVETQGVLNDPERVAALKAKGLPRHAYRFYAFTRDGKPCYDCGSRIEKISAGSRRLYFCPSCQEAL